MSRSTLVVESPTKAKTLKNMLKQIDVVSCKGHIRDLPEKKMGVDVDDGFKPHYVVSKRQKEVVSQLKKALQGAEQVYLATDPDREGEAIAWHLQEALKLNNCRRVVFHEITKPAVEKALQKPRQIDMDLVNAQQARRILDRLVGFSISPLLWRNVKGTSRPLSAGRVQSVALRLIVEREREIEAFKPEEYWTIHARFADPATGETWFEAKLAKKEGKEIKPGNEEEALRVKQALEHEAFVVDRVAQRVRKKAPPAPFRTSTLQQEANRRLGLTAARTMQIAQTLYEGVELDGEQTGLITYMRTDSVRVGQEAQAAARREIGAQFGSEYVPEKPPFHKGAKGAQEAHEAIRPTDAGRTPESLKGRLSAEQFKLYDLIYRRFLASQMAQLEEKVTDIAVVAGPFLLEAKGTQLVFDGYLRAWDEERKEQLLPPLEEGWTLNLKEVEAKQHFTQPPPRYTEATLVKALEEKGIGRPSTYAPILDTIKRRGYVNLEKRALVPTDLGKQVTGLLLKHFPGVMDVTFTARMEDQLDEVEQGKEQWQALLSEFYGTFSANLSQAKEQMEKIHVEPEKTGIMCPACGKEMVLRRSKFGKFYGCSGFPDCKEKKPLGSTGIACPKQGCGGEVIRRFGKKRSFYGCSRYPDCDFTSFKLPGEEKKEAAAAEAQGGSFESTPGRHGGNSPHVHIHLKTVK